MAIAFVAATSAAAASNELTSTATITITDATDMVVAYGSGLNLPSGITFDSTGTPAAMTSAVTAQSAVGEASVGIFYILDANLPGAGTYTIQGTWGTTGNVAVVGGVALSGVTQATPGGTGSNFSSAASSAILTVTVAKLLMTGW